MIVLCNYNCRSIVKNSLVHACDSYFNAVLTYIAHVQCTFICLYLQVHVHVFFLDIVKQYLIMQTIQSWINVIGSIFFYCCNLVLKCLEHTVQVILYPICRALLTMLLMKKKLM